MTGEIGVRPTIATNVETMRRRVERVDMNAPFPDIW
jgi:hypothetical protein